MDRAQKVELVSTLNQVFSTSNVVVVTHYSGLSVKEITDLRNQMREAGASFRVTKNRLTKLALEGTAKSPLSNLFAGPTAIGFSDDPVAAPKVLVKYAKGNDNLVVLGGMMGDQELSLDGINALAALPSMDELRGKLVGLLNAPATKIAGVLQAPAGQLARVLGAYSTKDAA